MIEISSKLTVRTVMKSENYIVRMQKIKIPKCSYWNITTVSEVISHNSMNTTSDTKGMPSLLISAFKLGCWAITMKKSKTNYI